MDDDEIARAQIGRIKERQEAYRNVFGEDGKRTVFQEAVLDDLRRFTKFGDTTIVKDGEGRFDGGLTAYKAGLQDVMKRVLLHINWRGSNDYRSTDSQSAE